MATRGAPLFFLAVLPVVAALSGPPEEGLRPGIKPPDFSLPNVTKGGQTTLHDFAGKGIVIVHFWKSKWKECQAEFPPLKRIFKEYPAVTILSINPIDMAGRIKADAEHYELPYDVLAGRDSEIISDYELIKLPRVIILDRNGVITYTERFAPYEKLNEELQKILDRWPPLAQDPQLFGTQTGSREATLRLRKPSGTDVCAGGVRQWKWKCKKSKGVETASWNRPNQLAVAWPQPR
jgi:peroxiredoxin